MYLDLISDKYPDSIDKKITATTSPQNKKVQ